MSLPKPVFYDTHCHLDDPKFAGDFEAMIARAQAAGITKCVTVGTDFERSRRAIELAERWPGLWAVAGWHPSDAPEAPAEVRPTLRELAQHPKVVALGETGLDYYWLPSKHQRGTVADDEIHKRQQAELFQQHLAVAAETGLKVVIHQRDAFDDLVAQFQPWAGRVRAVFHCFGETPERLRRVLELGALVSFTGNVTFKNADNIRACAAAVPAGRFMLETDAPYMAPMPHRGQRCEPAFVPLTAACVAQARGCSLEELSAITCATAQDFFGRLARD
jgi:TatD DNase family protein